MGFPDVEKGPDAETGLNMLILGPQRLVLFEVPKTGSLALRAMVTPHLTDLLPEAPRHTRARPFLRDHARALAQALGGPVETVAVVRDPLRRMQSWYRYRLRDEVRDNRISTREMSFEHFMLDYLTPKPPAHANVGRQDRFVGWDGKAALVDHLFDYRRLDLLVAFLSDRVGVRLKLPWKNVSPEVEGVGFDLSDDVMAQYLALNSAEFDLSAAVRQAGHLRHAV